MIQILLVGNELGTVADLGRALDSRQFRVECATTEARAVNVLNRSHPHLILLELPSPDSIMLSMCRRLRDNYPVPIVVCSSSSREQDVVRALDAGADDYLVMPIRPVELMARLRAVLRRLGDNGQASPNGQRLVAGDLEILIDEQKAFRRGAEIDLSPIEFKLLALLVRETGRPVSHSKLIAQVWGPEYTDCRHYLRLYVRYLRAKLEDSPQSPELIQNEWGVGYRFEPKPV
ncbi:MAG: response regulator transcription factor [Chloroflexi bacterium]|nr:MAG: response regulator transcription factor [Chloroflexota bacterium]